MAINTALARKKKLTARQRATLTEYLKGRSVKQEVAKAFGIDHQRVDNMITYIIRQEAIAGRIDVEALLQNH